jgi:hypothetical protein
MKDINRPIRLAFFNALNGFLTYDSGNVPVHDKKQKREDNSNNYVILGTVSSTPDHTQQSFDKIATIDVDIVTKAADGVTSDVADNIAGQITTLLFTAPFTHTLTAPDDWQFLNLEVIRDTELPLTLTATSFQLRRVLTFQLRVVQN